jgi:hypothetical protein
MNSHVLFNYFHFIFCVASLLMLLYKTENSTDVQRLRTSSYPFHV